MVSQQTVTRGSDTRPVVLDGQGLLIQDIVRVARRRDTRVTLSANAPRNMRLSRELLQKLIDTRQPIYGVTTGFGDSANRHIAPEKAAELQSNIIRYHLNGTGPEASSDVVRATMLIRANCLARGMSGVTPELVQRLVDFLNHDVTPMVPERGSVGASGDLVPLCYVAAPLIGEGDVRYRGEVRAAGEVLAETGLGSIDIGAKDGLALINGTSFSAAFAALAVADAEEIAVLAEAATALAGEALLVNRGHFAAFLHEQKPHRGQLASAEQIRHLLAGSDLAMEHSQVLELSDPLDSRTFQELTRSVQDRYSIRCAPHVIGVLRDTADWARQLIQVEVNSATDNPLVDVVGGTVHSGGNFYGGHVAQAMDALKTAVANVADLLDRQVELLVDKRFNNGLPGNLIAPVDPQDWDAGLHHGFKGMQIACSAVTAEALKHTMPASVFSRSTEAHNQDKVSMSAIAARDARTVIALVQEVLAIQLLTAAQGVDLRGAELMGPRTRTIHSYLRGIALPVLADRRMDHDVNGLLERIRSGELAEVVTDSGATVE